LFKLTLDHNLEGIVTKELADPYEPRTKWLKYSQREGAREDLQWQGILR
jgi:ATP-dependent DNA ligase